MLSDSYELATFDTRLRALDPYQHELLCLDVNTTMLLPGAVDSVYGHAHILFWCTVGLAIGYWAIVGIARLVAAWGRGSSRGGSGILARIESAGFILASALSGERFASSPALMRFCKSSFVCELSYPPLVVWNGSCERDRPLALKSVLHTSRLPH